MLTYRLPLLIVIHYFIVFSDGFAQTSDNWVDEQHQQVQSSLQQMANNINSWFGENDEQNPAKAGLRVMIDQRWNHYEGYSLRPRIRGSLRLPALQDKISVVFGDETMDHEFKDAAELMSESRGLEHKSHFSMQDTKRTNSSVALQWSPARQNTFDSKFSLGMRSGGDIYVKTELSKDNQYHRLQNHNAIIYRYGLKSQHYVRGNLDFNYQLGGNNIASNQTHIDYHHDDDEEKWGWGNRLSYKHLTGKNSWYHYGVYTGGNIKNKQFSLNSYGPFISMRRNLLRDWLFIQPELTYYNNKEQDYQHNIGIMLRLEMQF
ncbi:hypothetical protein [Dichelobacter nodosus]|uniref:Uncharacterized protein n=1 Tax=Dichelobacter nodosus (strain VCS1703A) TaxID=246195 RepID=A5EWW7_DICNV|nr:hypothetical protein [Dichelobacter nodosus]ABQ14012.1 conserved hypothetical protein [Dichelobacter nodosus VCS1703A]TGA65842.1 hypothetical protein E5E99_02065 [Dichelobacter nodosus]